MVASSPAPGIPARTVELPAGPRLRPAGLIAPGRPRGPVVPAGVGPVRCAAFSADGRLVASFGPGGRFASLRGTAADAGALRGLEVDEPIRHLAFAADGRTLAGCGDRAIVLWDVEQGERMVDPWEDGATASCVALGRWDDAGGGLGPGDPPVRSADRPPGGDPPGAHRQRHPPGHLGRWTPARLGGADRSIRLWPLGNGDDGADPGRAIAVLPMPGGLVEALAFSPDGRRLAASAAGGGITVWDVTTRRLLARPDGLATAMAFSADGRSLAAGMADRQGEGVVIVWDVATGRRLARRDGPGGRISALVYATDGALLALGDRDGIILRWRTCRGRQGPAGRNFGDIRIGTTP